MSFITILLIAIGLSMDSLAVSISGGICMKPFCIKKSLKMALTMGIFQGGMTWLGWAMGIHFSNYITDFDHWIAFVLLSYLGGKMVYESFKEEDSHLITFSSRMLFTLGVATSIDALAVGVSMAFLKTGIWFPASVIAFTTFFLSFSGVICGYCSILGNNTPVPLFSIYDTRIRRPLHTNTRTTPKQIQVTTNHNNKVIFPQLNINIHPATGKSATAIATSQTLLRNIRLSVLFTAPQTKLFFHQSTSSPINILAGMSNGNMYLIFFSGNKDSKTSATNIHNNGNKYNLLCLNCLFHTGRTVAVISRPAHTPDSKKNFQ